MPFSWLEDPFKACIESCDAPVQDLLEVPGLQDLLAGLGIYSQRHITRLDQLLRSSFLLDFTLARLQVVTPAKDLIEENMEDASQAALKEVAAVLICRLIFRSVPVIPVYNSSMHKCRWRPGR